MLGRQQIASLATALSELFKNSHDAYARQAKAEYFRKLNLLLVSDDGVGMDRATFEDAWLTIATESKLGPSPVSPPPGMRKRVQLGEKGIGRFAIGALGSQALVVSKRVDHSAIAALVSWKMFELPRVALDEVPVSLIEMDSTTLTSSDMKRLKGPLAEAAIAFRKLDNSAQWRDRLEEILRNLDVLPDDLYGTTPDLEPIGESGTVFFVSPVSEDLPLELESQDTEASSFARTLFGFNDAWSGGRATTDFSVDFIDHRGGGDSESVLEPDRFFQAADFESADHHILGRFDEKGDFFGTVRIFDEPQVDVEISCPGSLKPRCGPFSFELAVVQGLASESRLDPDEFARMTTRLKLLGGLYVYMDGIRVQPYGRPDVDYLKIEERRTLGAGYYYFSYRRMFGAVGLTSDSNPELQEKAGREGFTQGRAFSDFRTLLINLLVELAATFFRKDAAQARDYEKGRERLQRQARLRSEREKQAADGRRQLRAALASALQFLNETDFQERASEIVLALEEQLDGFDRLQPATRRFAQAKQDLARLLEPLEFDDPSGFAPTDSMQRDMLLVERGIADVEQSYVGPALSRIEELAAEVEERLGAAEADEQERREFISERFDTARERVRVAEDNGTLALQTFSETVQSSLQELRSNFDDRLRAIAEPVTSGSSGWIQEQAEFERAVDSLASESNRAFARLENRVQASGLVFSEGAATPTELAAAADAEIVELRAQADLQLELVHLGMALSVVDHEFSATISSIRTDVRRVGSWAKKNPRLRGLYEDLRRDFDHLDSYLTLLTPMQRRVRRAETTIKGSDISRFLKELFRERLKEGGVEIHASRDFQAVKIVGYASTYYPVFVNLVDNSLYWIRQSSPEGPNAIELSTRGEALVYRDSGPGIDKELADRVFDFGYTTKPGGRGLGLAIASQVLDRAGWSILLGDCSDGAEFVIRPRRET